MERNNREAQNSRLFLPAVRKKYPLALKEYLHPDDYYKDGVFVEVTGGDGETETFRQYLRTYIRNFRPRPFLKDKSLRINLRRDGEFFATEKKGRDPSMSKEEETIFQYLCYLYVFAFWEGFEKMRDIHYESMPMVIQDFAKELRDKEYFNELINMAKATGKKVIIRTQETINL